MKSPYRARNLTLSVALLLVGAVAGKLANALGLPMPFMLGSLVSTALIAGFWGWRFPGDYAFPQTIRQAFVGAIGVMIGAQVRPEMIAELPRMAASFAALTVFVLIAFSLNYQIFRRIGGYDRATAFYSGAPGGLMESIAMGEEAGADLRVLTLLQFLRIVLVVTIMPLVMSIWHGGPVGSAAGMSLSNGPTATGWQLEMKLLALAALSVAGIGLGRLLRLPAAVLTGPLFLSALVCGSGLIELNLPGWVIASAQVVLGGGLGLRFIGVSRTLLMRGAGVSFLSVSAMLALGFVISLALSRTTGLSLDHLVVSFAPGGVTEMSLVALSLAANPAIVTLHHLYRIIFTVVVMGVMRKSGRVPVSK